MYIPQTSGHVSDAIKNYVLDEFQRYIRYNLLELSCLKIRTHFFSTLRNRGFKKKFGFENNLQCSNMKAVQN